MFLLGGGHGSSADSRTPAGKELCVNISINANSPGSARVDTVFRTMGNAALRLNGF